MEWITENREWFFSGAGIFAASAIVSLASVFITLWLKSRSERKRRKKLRISQMLNRFTVPTSQKSANVSPEHFKVSYKGKEYENLAVYYVSIMNVGIPAIERQKIHIVFPQNAQVIETINEKSLNSIIIEKTELKEKNKQEEVYIFDRLEPNDACGITYLLDVEDTSMISYEPRGVDDIEYVRMDEVGRTEIESLIFLFAMFFICGSIPVIGGLAQGVVIIASTPKLLDFYHKVFSKKSEESSLHIEGGIYVNEDGVINISQSR